jgi:flagellar hook-associated protein 2
MGISLNPATLLSGQGIDVSSLVQQVLSEQSGQLTQWQSQESTLQTQASALTSINTDLTSLATAVSALSDPLGALTAQAATSSDTSVLTATTQGSSTAGTHQITVTSLATAGSVYTAPLASGDKSFLANGATSGDIQVTIGGTTQNIAITQGSNDTLNTLASYINRQNWGVTANVVTDANGARLALFSQLTGTAGALNITNNTTALSFQTPSGGTNASLTVDGIPISSASNTVSGVIPGITLNLVNASPNSSVQLTVGSDATQVTQAINNFVSAYNQVISDINSQYTVNAATNSEGPLGSDTALRQLQQSLLGDATYSVSGDGGLVNLASLGINMNDDGTLTVDTSQLSNVIATNPSAVQNFFQNSSSTGFANSFNGDLTNLTNPIDGVLNADLAANQAEQTDLNNSISNFQQQLSAQQQQLTNEFSQVDASLQSYPLLLQEVTQSLGALGSGSSSSSGTSSPILTSGL